MTKHTPEQICSLMLFLRDYADYTDYVNYAHYADYTYYVRSAASHAKYAARYALKARTPPLIPLVYKALSL